MFDKLVAPILNYGCEIWGFSNASVIERVQFQFLKKVLVVKKTTQNDFIYGELGRVTLQTKSFYTIIKYWLSIVLNTNENKYIVKVYNMLKSDIELFPNRNNWCSLLKQLLCTLGLYHVWLAQYVGNEDVFLFLVKQRLNDHFVQNWNSRLDESSRAKFYRQISSFKFQPYLDNINMLKFCQALTKLRVSSHRLAVEAGRWNRPVRTPYDDRKCIFCNLLEDEYHFVLECPIYVDMRKKYISKYYWNHPSMFKFINLINNTNVNIVKKLGMYVFHAFKLRSERLLA